MVLLAFVGASCKGNQFGMHYSRLLVSLGISAWMRLRNALDDGAVLECYGLDDVDSLLLEKSYVMDWDISNVLKWLGSDYRNLVR